MEDDENLESVISYLDDVRGRIGAIDIGANTWSKLDSIVATVCRCRRSEAGKCCAQHPFDSIHAHQL